MRKLLFIFLLLPLLSFGQTQLNINQLAPNFRTGGIWKSMGTVMYGDLPGETGLEEPSLLYETGAQLLTNTTGSVFKMMFTQEVGAVQNVMYAESLDGLIWQRSTTICIANHARGYLAKFGSTYYYYCVPTSTFGQVDVYTSSTAAPGSWTLSASNIISLGTAGTWNANSLANMAVYFDGATYQMLLSGNKVGGAVFTTGYYHSTSPTSGWTQYGSNPVFGNPTTPLEMQPGSLSLVGSTWYCWGFGGSATILPTDGYRLHSSNLTTWTTDNSGNATYSRTQADEGVATSTGQVGNTFCIEANGKCYLFYCAVGDGNGIANGIHLKLAIANMTMANLILTNEGNGTGLNTAQPSVYDQTQSDYRYIPNSTNIGGASPAFTTGSITLQLDPSNQYGIRLRSNSPTTTQSVILPAFYYANVSGATNYIQGTGSGWTFNAGGGYNFNNGSGSGTPNLGNFDNTGLLTTANGVTIQGGAFNYQSGTAFAATATFGLTLRNQSAATAGTPVRWSPAAYRNGTAWDLGTLASKQMYAYDLLEPISANPASYKWVWRGDNNFGGDIDLMTLAEGGNLTPAGNITLPLGKEIKVTEGSGGFAGQATLSSGVSTITISGVTTSSRAFISLVSQGGTSTTTWHFAGVCTSNTLTITAVTTTGSTNTSDASVVNYFIIN